MAARHPARVEPPIVRQGYPEAQDILVSIQPTGNCHPPGSVYAIMRTLGSCGDDDGCAMQVSPAGRRCPVCFAHKGCQFARKVCRFAFQRPKRHREGRLGATGTPDNMSNQRRPSTSGGLFLSKKGPLPDKMAAMVRKPCREEQHPGDFRAQKCPKHASVLTAKVCGKHGEPS